MKKLIVLVLISALLQCKGQTKNNTPVSKDTLTSKNQSTMYRPKLDAYSEKLNLHDFEDGLYDMYKNKVNLDNIDIGNTYRYEKEKDGSYIRLYGGLEGCSLTVTPKNSIYSIVKVYYENLMIKSKSIMLSHYTPENDLIFSSVILGKEYQYNEKGELIKTIEHDAGYDFSFEQAYEYVKNNFKDDEQLKRGEKYTYSFERAERNGIKYWKIRLHIGDLDSSYTETVLKLDAKTGEVLSQKEYLWETMKPVKLKRIIVPDKTGKEESNSSQEEERKNTSAYKTYEGKDYTETEWKIKEQELYNEHLKNTGRGDLIKPTDKPKTDGKKSNFLADEDDVKPEKKKGFFGGLLG